MQLILGTLAILGLVLAASAQPNTTELYEHSAVLDANELMRLYWKFDVASITFEIHGNTTGWIGIGISPSGSMVDSDISTGWVKNGVATLTDRHGESFNGFPPLDAEQNVELLEGFEMDGWTVIKFRRLLVNCDSEDRDITGDTLRVIFAWNDNDPSGDDLQGYHGPTNRGVKSLMLLEPTRTDENAYPSGETHVAFDLLNDKVAVPILDTYYHCRLMKMPELTEKHHMVKIEPVIQKGNELNVHHILVYQCTDDANITTHNVDHECHQNNMPPDFASCQFVIVAWAIGSGAFHYPKHTGFPLGIPGAPKYVVLETHYDNPDMKPGIVDSSGLRIYYTSNLRQYDAGVMEVGHMVNGYQDIIPPNAESFLDVGECSSNCLGSHMKAEGYESIKVFGVMLHGHLLARGIQLKHIRNGTELPYLSSDSSYDFNLQETRFLAEEREVLRGDAWQIICNYNSQNKKHVTLGGLSTTDEMCLAYVYYYPKLSLTFCKFAPNANSVMSYFGITSYWYSGSYDGVPSLHGITVTSPPELANMTAYDVVNERSWDEASADKYSYEARNVIQEQRCKSSGPTPPEIKTFIEPLTIDEPYVPPDQCTESPTSSTADLNTTTTNVSGADTPTSTIKTTTTTPAVGGSAQTTSAASMARIRFLVLAVCSLTSLKLVTASYIPNQV